MKYEMKNSIDVYGKLTNLTFVLRISSVCGSPTKQVLMVAILVVYLVKKRS